MTEKHCTDCKRPDDGEDRKRLITGEQVCGYCPKWRNECEARHLLTMRLVDRQKALGDRLRIRGWESVEELKQAMTLIHAAKKNSVA